MLIIDLYIAQVTHEYRDIKSFELLQTQREERRINLRFQIERMGCCFSSEPETKPSGGDPPRNRDDNGNDPDRSTNSEGKKSGKKFENGWNREDK